MTMDPIVQEVRKVRDEIAQEQDYDIDAIFAALRRAALGSGTERVTLAPRRPAATPQLAPGRAVNKVRAR